MSRVVIVRGYEPQKLIRAGLNALQIHPERKVVIKPNLTVNKPYPATTSPLVVNELISYFKAFGKGILIAEGSGFIETRRAYKELGYLKLGLKHGVQLIDLNKDEYSVEKMSEALLLKEFKLPKTLKNSYVISAAVLKRHPETKVSLSLKNMLGALIGDKKSFHDLGIDEVIVDVNLYVKPNLAVVDCRKAFEGEGMYRDYGLMVFSEDLVAADAVAAKLLKLNPLEVKHIKLAVSVGLGSARLDRIELIEAKA